MTTEQINFIKEHFGCHTASKLTSLGTASIVPKEELLHLFGNNVDKYFKVDYEHEFVEVSALTNDDVKDIISNETNLPINKMYEKK